MQSYWFCLALALAWFGASAGAFRVFCFPLRGWPDSLTALGCLGGSLFLIPAAEAILVSILVCGSTSLRRRFDRRWSRAASAALVLAAGLLLTAGLMATMLSWWLRAHGPGFLQASALRSAVEGVSTVIPLVGHTQALSLLSATIAAVTIAALLLRLAPAASLRQLCVLLFAFAIILALLAGSSRFVPRFLLDTGTAGRMEAVFRSDLLPSATLLWKDVIFPQSTPPAPVQALIPRRPLPAPNPSGARPNIILFVIESFRGGQETRTAGGAPVMPALSRLAREGIQYNRAYAAGNESASSMSAILTSLHVLKYAVRDNYLWNDFPIERFTDVLSPAYLTAFFSSSNEDWQDMRRFSKSPTLDRFFDANSAVSRALPVPDADSAFRDAVRAGTLKTGSLDDQTTTTALQHWIGEIGRTTPRKPFLAVVSLQASHFPYQQGFQIESRFVPADLSPEDMKRCSFFDYPPEFVERMKNRYWNSLSYIDRLLQQTLDFLEQNSLLDRTILIATGDHGEMFYENGAATHSKQLHEGVLHVPLVVWGAPQGGSRVYSEPVSLLDIGPTILQLAGFPPHAGFQGRALTGMAAGATPSGPFAYPVFSTVQNMEFEDSVVVGDWRLTRQQNGLYETLYNVAADPLEREDLSAKRPEIMQCLDATLAEFRQNELGYYAHPDLVKSHFPPATRLADVPACAILNAGACRVGQCR